MEAFKSVIGEKDNSNKTKAEDHIVPFAFTTQLQHNFIPKINSAVKYKQHRSHAQQHPKNITVSHTRIIADAWTKTNRTCIRPPQQKRYRHTNHRNSPLEPFKSSQRIMQLIPHTI